jgi:putative endonuclease
MRFHNYFIYITTNPEKTVLYTGVTNNLEQRLIEHYLSRGNGVSFAGGFYCYGLLYYERFTNIKFAIKREKQIKSWRRDKKEKLIAIENPGFCFLNDKIMPWPPENDAEARGSII